MLDYLVGKAVHFGWRAGRNLMCVTPWGRELLFPVRELAETFGRDDAAYGIGVFLHHYRQLAAAGFTVADSILEVGPGRNLGTSLLMWSLNQTRSKSPVRLVLWDVYQNAIVDPVTLRRAAEGLLASPEFHQVMAAAPGDRIDDTLRAVAGGQVVPDIRYRVEPMSDLAASREAHDVALVYSHAAIEHIWDVAPFWKQGISLTKKGGWHSHRIDLADHGTRDTNYIEMLDWSPAEYWLTMRFVPAAINRWRASEHLAFVEKMGIKLLSVQRDMRPSLPTPVHIHHRFRNLSEADLRTVAIDFVGVRMQ